MTKIARLPKVTALCEVKGDRAMRLICQGLFNNLGITAWGSPIRYDDTVATYAVSTEERLSRGREATAKTFAAGMLAGMSASGLI